MTTMRPEGRTEAENAARATLPAALDCVHCGLCLDTCTTYRISGDETESPRGRIALLRAEAEGRLDADAIAGPLDRCVGCRACESVCPSQVQYHVLLEAHRDRTASPRLLRRLDRVFSSRRLLHALGLAARAARRLGLLRLAATLPSARLRALASAVPSRPRRRLPRAGSTYPALGERRGAVSLHLGCVQPELLGGVVDDALAVLRQQGFEVHVPAQPTCCGALHAHAGGGAEGRALARATLTALQGATPVVPSAGCAAHLHGVDPQAGAQEVLLFLAAQGLRGPLREQRVRVAYDPPCHLDHALGARDQVPALLRSLPGVELVAHAHPEVCCGAGGISFLREAEQGLAMAAAKAEALADAAPDVVVTGNPGCLMQVEAGLRARGLKTPVLHPLALLRAACDA